MNTPQPLEPAHGDELVCRELSLPELVAQVYDEAPAAEDRARLLQPMLAVLGLLSLAGVAGGIFSWLRLSGTGAPGGIGDEWLHRVRPGHVTALAEQAQQVDPDVMQGLAGALQSSPALCATAAATVLLAVLARQALRAGRRDRAPA